MENDYRITKLHGTLIGDNRIPDLPVGEKTKVFSSTNGKTAWVDLPTDVGKDANGFAVLCHDGTELAGQRKSIKLADILDNGAIIGRDQTTSAPQTDELITKAYGDKSYVQLNKDNEFKSGTLSFGLNATLQTESISGGTVGNVGSSTIMLIPSGNNDEGGVSFVSKGSAFSMGLTGMAINTTGDFFVGEDFSDLNPAWKAVTGLLSPWQFGDLTKGYEAIGFVNAKDFEGRANAPSPSRLTFFSPLGKVSWFDMAGSAQYDYQLPKKSGTIALTSDLSEAGTSVTIRRW